MNDNTKRLSALLGNMPEFEGLGTIAACERAAEALDAAGVVVQDWEYTHWVTAMRGYSLYSDGVDPLPEVRATHRRLIAKPGPWEAVDPETAPISSSIITGSLP